MYDSPEVYPRNREPLIVNGKPADPMVALLDSLEAENESYVNRYRLLARDHARLRGDVAGWRFVAVLGWTAALVFGAFLVSGRF